jgi:hypothetical protein
LQLCHLVTKSGRFFQTLPFLLPDQSHACLR